MKIKWTFIFSFFVVLFASLHSEAQSSQTPQEAFCQRVEKQELNQWLYKNENRLAFSNSGGRLGIGLCWWHARFQRRLNHLLVFTGNENTPTSCPLWNHHQIDELFSRVLDYKMTEIPCYKNLFDFSQAHKFQLEGRLSDWQVKDTWNLHFIRGLEGKPTIPAEELAENMRMIMRRSQIEQRTTYVLLQMPGVPSHAWLVIAANPVSEKEMHFDVVDSNFPKHILRVRYTNGQQTFKFPRDLVAKLGPPDEKPKQDLLEVLGDKGRPYEEFSLFIQYESELEKLRKANRRYCH